MTAVLLLWSAGAVGATECAAPPVAQAAAPGDPRPACAFLELDVAGRAFATLPSVGTSRGVALQRLRSEVALQAPGGASARLSMVERRSGGEDGYIGIDGESLVPVLQVAEVRWDWRAAGLAVAAGVVDDPWVMALQPAWDGVALAQVMVVDQGTIARADVGGWASFTSKDAVATVTAALTTGEGFQRRERNNGTNLTGVARLRPLARSDSPARLELLVMAREGSRGLGQAPDHRAGLGAVVAHDWIAAGTDAMLGWGLQGDGTLLPAGASLWAHAGVSAPIAAWARVDQTTDNRQVQGAGERLFLVAGGPRLPGKGASTSLLLGWQGRTLGPNATGSAGAAAGTATHTFFVQLGGRIGGWLPLMP